MRLRSRGGLLRGDHDCSRLGLRRVRHTRRSYADGWCRLLTAGAWYKPVFEIVPCEDAHLTATCEVFVTDAVKLRKRLR